MSSLITNVSILGSTGSIGVSTLEVVRLNPKDFNIIALSCNSNLKLLSQQIQEFNPQYVSVGIGYKNKLKEMLPSSFPVTIYEGTEGNCLIAELNDVDKVIAAIMGAEGLLPIISAIKKGKIIAIANKEPIVLAGFLLDKLVKQYSAKILPLDSEHNAIFQAIQGSNQKGITSITLTASGGPFLHRDQNTFSDITLAEALKHPNWVMGDKITVDSATMMNKCLEIIEAKWLFDLSPDQIDVVVHPESIIHSLANFKDGSSLAQLGETDMKVPIAYCLGYPNRIESSCKTLKFSSLKQLTFLEPDFKKFPTLKLAYKVLSLCPGAPAVLNGANEKAVSLLFQGKIKFYQILLGLEELIEGLEATLKNTPEQIPEYIQKTSTVEEAIQADQWGRQKIQELYTL